MSRKPLSRKPLSRKPLSRKPLSRKPLSRKPPNRKPLSRDPLGRKLPILGCLALAVIAISPPASAQELYTYTLSAFGGLGGALEARPGDNLDNTGFQLGASLVTEPHTRVALRAGELGLGDGGPYERFDDARLSYLTLSGEYRFAERYYDSWVYLGLGGYRVEGDDAFGPGDRTDTALGLAVGLVGEFDLTRSLDVQVEVSGHYAELEDSQIFAMGHAGLAFHF